MKRLVLIRCSKICTSGGLKQKFIMVMELFFIRSVKNLHLAALKDREG